MRSWIPVAGIALFAVLIGPAAAGPHAYVLTEFKGLPHAPYPGVSDLNNVGAAVGSLDGSQQQGAFWNSPTNPQLLPGSVDLSMSASGLNDLGNSCGTGFVDPEHQRAVYWEGTTRVLILPDLNTAPDLGNSNCYQLNNAGAKVGKSQTPAGATHAVMWDSSNSAHDLGTLQGAGDSEARGINLSGSIVGTSSFIYSGGINSTHAVLWQNGIPTDLSTLGGLNSAAYAINASGQIAGQADLNIGSTGNPPINHPILWSAGQNIDLGVAPGFLRGGAYSINAAGTIVGELYNSPDLGSRYMGSHAVLWDQGEMVDLTALLHSQVPARVHLWSASRINDAGEILIYGFDHTALVGTVYVATPISPVSVTLRSNDNPAYAGDPINFISTVTADSGQIPHASVTLKDGSTVLQVANLSQGIARFRPISNLGVGTHRLTVSFTGYGAFASGTSPVLNQVVRFKLIPVPPPHSTLAH